MKKTRLMAAMAAVTAGAVLASTAAYAQTTPIGVWQPPQHGEADPAKQVPATPQPTPATDDASQQTAQPTTQPQSAATYPQPYTAAPPAREQYEGSRGGFFLGAQGGKGWVFEDVDQSALSVNAGYRWQAGAITLVGIEAAAGRLDETQDDLWTYSKVEYGSVGVNARFNFGATSPVFALFRAGYWAAEDNYGMDVEGGYAGLGLGVDFNHHFNMSLVYTNYVYFQDYYWEGDDFYYDINRADTLMLGVEVRF